MSGVTEDSKIRFVTANYAQLQGLRLVPLGAFLVLFAAMDLLGFMDAAGVPPAERTRFLTRMGFAYWIALLLALAAPLYYRHRYGSVEGLDRGQRNRWITAAVIGFLVLPISLKLVLVSVSLFVTAWREEWIRPYYPAVAVAWLVAACLPALGGTPPPAKLTLFALGGLTLIVIGVGDHLFLRSSLAKPSSLSDASHPTTI